MLDGSIVSDEQEATFTEKDKTIHLEGKRKVISSNPSRFFGSFEKCDTECYYPPIKIIAYSFRSIRWSCQRDLACNWRGNCR